MNNLAKESLVFAERVGDGWKDAPMPDCLAAQEQFLCRQAFGAYHTAKSFWILHENGRLTDCIVLARNLLERIVNSTFGWKSPNHAVELIAHEYNTTIKQAEQWDTLLGGSPNLQQVITENKKALRAVLSLLNKTEAGDWKIFKRFEECGSGMERCYRSLYFHFSRYAHAGFEVPRPGKHNEPSEASEFVALLAPVLTAINYHRRDGHECSHGKCRIGDEGMALAGRFSNPIKALGSNLIWDATSM